MQSRRHGAEDSIEETGMKNQSCSRFFITPFAWIATAMLLAAPGCTRFQILNSLVPACGFHCVADLPYGPLPRQKLDVYVPTHPKPNAAVVIFFYGGDWQTGSKHDYAFVGQALASRGFVAILPDYRLYPEVTFPAFVEDGARAARWAHDHAAAYGGDPSAVFLAGHSAGAHIAALLTLDRHYLAAVGMNRSDIRGTAALSGPYDFTPSPADLPPFAMRPGDVKPEIEPIHFVDGRAPPMLLIQGLSDRTVNPTNTVRLAASIAQHGGSVRTVYVANRGHVAIVLSLAFPFRWLAPTLDEVSAFFYEQSAARPTANPHVK
jgi:acetyl esterase/lipase